MVEFRSRLDRLARIRRKEQPLARERLPQHDARREDVGARVDRLILQLFGRHVRDLALDRAACRHSGTHRGLRDAEVQNAACSRPRRP